MPADLSLSYEGFPCDMQFSSRGVRFPHMVGTSPADTFLEHPRARLCLCRCGIAMQMAKREEKIAPMYIKTVKAHWLGQRCRWISIPPTRLSYCMLYDSHPDGSRQPGSTQHTSMTMGESHSPLLCRCLCRVHRKIPHESTYL